METKHFLRVTTASTLSIKCYDEGVTPQHYNNPGFKTVQ